MSFLSVFIFVKHDEITRERKREERKCGIRHHQIYYCVSSKSYITPYNRIQCFKQKISPDKRKLLKIQIVTHNITAVVSNNQSK